MGQYSLERHVSLVRLMNLNEFNLALKMIQADYKLSPEELERLTLRLLADDREFERIWALYKRRRTGKTDVFIEGLRELLET
jgi:hypothetical protein